MSLSNGIARVEVKQWVGGYAPGGGLHWTGRLAIVHAYVNETTVEHVGWEPGTGRSIEITRSGIVAVLAYEDNGQIESASLDRVREYFPYKGVVWCEARRQHRQHDYRAGGYRFHCLGRRLGEEPDATWFTANR